jgi:uncharacterized protein (DUF1697 family)
MAASHAALVRGINVGRKRVAMADLRRLVAGLGYTGVGTLLNSGNVVFTTRATAASAAARLERALTGDLGITARVVVLTAREVAAIVRKNPLAEVTTNPSRLLVAVLAEPADRRRLVPLVRQDWAPDAMALGPRVAYLWCPAGILQSRLLEAVSRTLGEAVTSRNWGTMTKLHRLMQEPAG